MTPLEFRDALRLFIRLASEYPALVRRQRWTRDRIEAYQIEKLKQRLTDARDKVSMYRRSTLPHPSEIRSLTDWAELPILTKQDLLAASPADRISRDFKRDTLIESKSSGSTGQALDVYYDRESFYLFILAGFRLYHMAFRYMPWHRQTYIYTSRYPFDSLFGMFPMEFIPTLTPIPETLARLRRHPPDLLVCYPSHLRAIVEQMTPDDFQRIRPLAVNVNSEMSSAAERALLSQKLGTFVFDDYSSEELTRIACQCRHLAYHVFDDINYIEIVDDEGRPVSEGTVGNVVGTNLHNRAMPLLRYAQGDRAAIRAGDCPCGRSFRILEKLEGRKNDAFVLPSGERITSGFLLDLTYGVFLKYEGAVQAFCLLQDRPETWTLEIVPGSGWNETLRTRIPEDLMRDLRQPSVTIVVATVNQVTRTATGKANPIVARVSSRE